jgi:hypothetical protein
MLRFDLEAVGIDYEDASGLFFDFHALRCELATLADAAGVTPRVVQKMMRHSSLELTGRYTRPRAVDVESAASMLPSLKTDRPRPETMAATGTHGVTHQQTFAPSLPHSGDATDRIVTQADAIASFEAGASLGRNPLELQALSSPVASCRREAPPGFEPGMEVLQTSALPLGYGAGGREA